MRLANLLSLCLLILVMGNVQAQVALYAADSSILCFVKGADVYQTNSKSPYCYVKGNIVFRNGEDDRQNIMFMFTSPDLFSSKKQSAKFPDKQSNAFCYSAGKVMECDANTPDNTILLSVEKYGKWTAFYHPTKDSLLAYYASDSVSGGVSVWFAQLVIEKYKLHQFVASSQTQSSVTQIGGAQSVQPQIATIKPFWGNQTANEWMWDGEILRPRWNSDPRWAWTFDGTILKPYLGSNINLQYEWNGEVLKPVWRTVRELEWSYDGRIIKPIWSTDWALQYTIQDGVVKPWSNVHAEREWSIQGSIPIPIIVAVISGIAGQ